MYLCSLLSQFTSNPKTITITLAGIALYDEFEMFTYLIHVFDIHRQIPFGEYIEICQRENYFNFSCTTSSRCPDQRSGLKC